jgi:phage gp29-like protein
VAGVLPRIARAIGSAALGAVERVTQAVERAAPLAPAAREPNPYVTRYGSGSTEKLPSAAPTEEYEDLPISVWSSWTIASIRSAVTAFVGGNFGQASILAEAMIADDRIQASVNGRTKGVTKCEWALEPAKGGKRQAKELQKLLPDILPAETVEGLLFWAIFMGFALAEIIWESRDDKWIPRLKIWHPLHVYYRIDLRKYVAITTQGVIEIEEGDPKWFLFAPWGAYRGWLRGAVRSCSIPWVVRQLALRDFGRFSEVHGLPIKKLMVPSQAPAPDKARFFASVRNLGGEAVFNLPQQGDGKGGVGPSFDVQLLEARDRAWEAFPGLIGQCERSITLAIRGTNLTTELDGGSFAAANTHKDEDSDYAIADRKKLCAAVQKQLFRPFCFFNYGNANLAPAATLNSPESDQEKQATVLKTVADAVLPFEKEGWPVDRAVTAKRFGLDLRADVEANKPVEAFERKHEAERTGQMELPLGGDPENDDEDAGEPSDMDRDGKETPQAAE